MSECPTCAELREKLERTEKHRSEVTSELRMLYEDLAALARLIRESNLTEINRLLKAWRTYE